MFKKLLIFLIRFIISLNLLIMISNNPRLILNSIVLLGVVSIILRNKIGFKIDPICFKTASITILCWFFFN